MSPLQLSGVKMYIPVVFKKDLHHSALNELLVIYILFVCRESASGSPNHLNTFLKKLQIQSDAIFAPYFF
jgi:hypothetical protein